MPLAFPETNKPANPPVRHSVTSQPDAHAVYDNVNTPTNSLEAVLRGSPWKIDAYYASVLGTAEVARELDPEVPKSYQSYEKILGLEILVQDPLRSTGDTRTQNVKQVGSAVIYSFLVPNKFNYFIASTNIGRRALIVVTEVERLTSNKESVFRIAYETVEEITDSSPMYINLEQKVINTSVFSKERLLNGLPPVLNKKKYADVRSLTSHFKALANNYWRTFYRQEKGTLFIPGQVGYMYDPFLVSFFDKVVSSSDVPDKQYLVFLSENNDPVYETDNIWTILEKRGKENLPFHYTKMMMVSPMFFKHVALARSGFFANADLVVYPYEYDRSAHITPQKPVWGIHSSPGISARQYPQPEIQVERFDPAPTTNAFGKETRASDYTLEVAGTIYPAFNKVVTGDNYIFTEQFFSGQATSVMEIVLLDYIDRAPIDLNQLLFLIETYPKIARLEQFYFGPMLMVAIKEAIRGAYV